MADFVFFTPLEGAVSHRNSDSDCGVYWACSNGGRIPSHPGCPADRRAASAAGGLARRALFDLVVKNGYRRIVDAGTGRGASALWMALAARRTAGKVTPLEFNRFVRRQPGLNTTVLRHSRLGLAVSIKKQIQSHA